jgi:hypothetical protein
MILAARHVVSLGGKQSSGEGAKDDADRNAMKMNKAHIASW